MRMRMKSKIVVSGKWQVKSRAQRLVAISFLLLISYFLLLTSLLPTSAYAERQEIPRVGDLAPGFALYNLEGKGEYIRLSKLCGKEVEKGKKRYIVVLDFFATHCVPCKKELPILQRVYEKYKDKDVMVFLIDSEKIRKSKLSKFLKDRKVTIPVLLDPYKKTYQRYGLYGLPALFVLDKDGKIYFLYKGALSNLEEKLEEILGELIKE